MKNHILLKMCSRSLMAVLLTTFPVTGLAQTTKPETKYAQPDQIQAAQTQQIIAARSGYVSESEAENVPAPSATCGPKWLGGCWDRNQKQRGFGETAKDPFFLIPALALIGMNMLDAKASVGCGEAHDFGRHKRFGDYMAADLPADAAVITMAYFLKRGHIKYIPEAMLSYGVFVHTRGAVRGFAAHCN